MTALIEYRPGKRFEDCVSALIERDPPVNRCQYPRIALKVAAAWIAVLSKLPFIPVALQLGPILGPFAAIGNTVAFSVLRYWGAKHIIDDFLSPQTQAQIELLNENRYKTCIIFGKVVAIFPALILAVASQTDSVLPGVIYNEGMFKVVAAIVLLAGGIFLPTRSFQSAFNDLGLLFRRSIEARVTAIKTKMINLLLKNQNTFITLPHDEKTALITTLEGIRGSDYSPEKKRAQYIALLTDNHELSPPYMVQKVIRGAFSGAGFVAGLYLMGVFEYATTEYAYYGVRKHLVDDPYIGGAVAVASALSTSYLFATSIVKTTQRVCRTFGSVITGMKTRNLSWQLRLKTSFVLMATGLLMDALSAACDLVIFGDFYEQDNPIKREVIRCTMSLSVFLLLFTATLDVIDDIITFSITKGSEEEAQIVHLSLEFQKLAELIRTSPAQEFIGYLNSMDEESKALLLGKIDVTAEKLADLAD